MQEHKRLDPIAAASGDENLYRLTIFFDDVTKAFIYLKDKQANLEDETFPPEEVLPSFLRGEPDVFKPLRFGKNGDDLYHKYLCRHLMEC